MFHYKLYEVASLYGLFYTFPKRGDGIGMHTHEQSQQHNCVVLRGSVEIYGPNKDWTKTLNAGDVWDDLPLPHEVAALEDNTCVLGLFVNGRPEGEYLREEDKTGTITNKPLTIALPQVI